MGREAKEKRTPRLPKVTHIELDDRHTARRIILLAVLLVISLAALAISVVSILSVDAGWKVIEPDVAEANCSDEITYSYYLEKGGLKGREIFKSLTKTYSALAVDAYRLFEPKATFEGVGNLGAVNASPGKTVRVEKELYEALEKVMESGDRTIFAAPLFGTYETLFGCSSDEEAYECDPRANSEVAAFCAAVSSFALDKNSVDLRLCGDNTVCLEVSAEYAAFARENEVSAYIDFGYMKNAFAVDYLAQKLTEKGFGSGLLASYDGYTRVLDGDRSYSLDLYETEKTEVYPAAHLEYEGPRASVLFSAVPGISPRIYVGDDGSVRSGYIDPASGMPELCDDEIVFFAVNGSCVNTLLRAIPYAVRGDLDADGIAQLRADDVTAVFCRDRKVLTTGNADEIKLVYDDGSVRFTKEEIR